MFFTDLSYFLTTVQGLPDYVMGIIITSARLRETILKYTKDSSNVCGKKSIPHWTEDLFVNNPELFVKALEERISIVGHEVDVFLKCLAKAVESFFYDVQKDKIFDHE